jgi:uncharacterized protein (TIGR03437 family)
VSRTIAGIFPLGDGGPATEALLELPLAVAVDASGTMYIADNGNGVIRKVSKGTISTFAAFTGPIYDVKLDAGGNLYVAAGNSAFTVTPAGVATKIAGSASAGSFSGDGGPAINAGISVVEAIAIDNSGSVYLCDTYNNRIRKITADGIIHTIAGGAAGYAGDNGPATSALFNGLNSIAVDAVGNLYISDSFNDRIRKITLDGKISTFAGKGPCCTWPDTSGYIFPGPLTLDTAGNVYFFDHRSNGIYKVTPDGAMHLIAGVTSPGFAGDGFAYADQLARFYVVTGLATDAANNLYIVDSGNERIRKVDSGSGILTTVAGRGHFSGDLGPATAALLHRPQGTVMGSDGSVYITDTDNFRVRKIAPDGTIGTIAGNGDPYFGGDQGLATQATLTPQSLAIDAADNLFVVDGGYRVGKITPAGTISTVAGGGTTASSVDNLGALASGFAAITGIAVDSAGNVYLSESGANKIKKVTPSGGLSTYAGTGSYGFAGDGQPAAQAVFRTPGALALDAGGNLYIADTGNNRIRKIAAGGGTVSTVAGNGDCCYKGDGGPATAAQVHAYGLVAGAGGGLWMTDFMGVRYIGRDGTINRIAGGTAYGFAGDDATASSATRYYDTTGIALNSAGEVILADTYNSRIRALQPNNPVRMDIVSGNNQTGTSGTPLNAFIVRITGQSTVPPAGISVAFAVTAGAATLSALAAVTDGSGQAAISATPTKSGTLTIAATAGTFTAVFTATIADPVAPLISPGGIGQNGFSVPPVQTISPGAITTIYGFGFIAEGSASQINGISNGVLSTNFAGVCVTFDGVKAPIFGVTAAQITVAVPTLAPGTVAVQVLRNCGVTGELKSNALSVTAQAASPEFLYLVANANGVNPVAAVGSDGSFIGISGAAKAGDILVVYALGLGATNPAQTDGVPAAGAARVTLPVGVTIGGVALAVTDILYAGVSPSYIGLYQVNLRVPAGIASGQQPMVITVGTNQSPTLGYLTMQ